MQLLLITLFITCTFSWNLPWTKPQELNRGLPSSVQIYTLNTASSPFGTKLTGAYTKFNMNDSNLEMIVRDTNGDALGYFPKTPMQYASSQQNVVYAVINGGYFNMKKNFSSSFLAQNGKVKCPNEVNINNQNHPTVGAFGITPQGHFQTQYIYSYGQNFTTYKFDYPNTIPGPAPRQDQGKLWTVKEGIGAGPILVKNNQIIKNNVQNFDPSYMLNMRHPRSAICTDQFNNLYFLAMDGRYEGPDGSDGLTMNQLAQVMQSINCFNAMNLDGGGSTLLYANDKIVNRPSDPTGPRKVVSAVLLRDRNKKKVNLLTA